jgi:hypothetical protein
VTITHQGAIYRLQTTRQGKLILTKSFGGAATIAREATRDFIARRRFLAQPGSSALR